MKLIIAGSRAFSERAVLDYLDRNIPEGLGVTEVVSGCCDGPDVAGEKWAKEKGVLVRNFFPHWNQHGRAAGPIRNRQMAEYADAALVFWDGVSRGAKNMADEMEARGKPVTVIDSRRIAGGDFRFLVEKLKKGEGVQ